MKLVSIVIISMIVFISCTNENKDNSTIKHGVDNSVFETPQVHSEAKTSNPIISNDNKITIKFTPYVAQIEGIGSEASILLMDRLNSAIVKYGIAGSGSNPRFVIGSSVNVLSESITATAPTKYSNTYEINFMIVDVVTETIFNTFKTEFKGIGDSSEKAFISGLRNIDYLNNEFYEFLLQADKKIIAYYIDNCEKLLIEANTEAEIKNYDAAFLILNSIPSDAVDCFERIQVKKMEYFKYSLDSECHIQLAKMKEELGKFNDESGAGFNNEAMVYYSLIDVESECYDEAQKVYQNYLSTLKPEVRSEWIARKDSIKNGNEYSQKLSLIKANISQEGNKKLLAKYKYDESPWLIRLFSSGSKLLKGELNSN